MTPNRPKAVMTLKGKFAIVSGAGGSRGGSRRAARGGGKAMGAAKEGAAYGVQGNVTCPGFARTRW